MPKRALLAFAALLLILNLTLPAVAQSRSVYWERWDVIIDNVDTAANRFDVAEIYLVNFTGTFRFGSAVIPMENVEDIRNVQVYQNDQPLRESCSQQPGTFCVQYQGDEVSIRYEFFRPITNSASRFRLEYTVVGGLRVYQDGDQLWWKAIPEEHFGFPIGSSQITVQLPPGFAPREGIDPIETYGAPADIQVNGTTVVAQATEPIGGEGFFEIRVQYPHDPNARVPGWQQMFDERREYEENVQPVVNLGVAAIAFLIALGGPFLVLALWYTRGRDPQIGPVPEYLTEPPTDLPPAVVGTLLDERADLRDVMSTLIDLAHRGYIVMEEERKEGLFGIGSTSTFTFKRTDKPADDLRGFEQRILNNLFAGGRMERTLESLRNSFYTVIPQLQTDLYEELVREGLFTARPSSTRTFWGFVGGLVFVLAIIAFIGAVSLAETISPALLCIPMALGLTGVMALVVGQHMPAKTRKGAEDAAKWNAFREYIRNLDKYGHLEEAAQHFDDYLAYAIAFDVDRSWVRRFSKVENVPIPPWYYPTYLGPYRRGYVAGSPVSRPIGRTDAGELARADDGGLSLDDVAGNVSGGLDAVAAGLTTMLNDSARILTSQPQPQSSGSSGRWSSGGRSWSGGGFRGGGASGGGSRGFG
jgi:uncharacterized membrane protein